MAATITGTIAAPTTATAKRVTVTFIPRDTPQAVGSQIVGTINTSVITSATGELPASTILVEGNYTVRLHTQGTEYGSFQILVPSGDDTYDIADLITERAIFAGDYLLMEADDGDNYRVYLQIVEGQPQFMFRLHPGSGQARSFILIEGDDDQLYRASVVVVEGQPTWEFVLYGT